MAESEHAGPPEPLAELAALASWSDEEREALLEAVEEGDYSLADWLEAISTFETWLGDRGEERRPWRDIVGYIHCCTLMGGPGIALGSLNIIVNQTLIEFGFRAVDDPQI
jgi:hypothetical protein